MKKILSISAIIAISFCAVSAKENEKSGQKQQQILKELKSLKVLNSDAFKLNSVEDLGTMYMVNANMKFKQRVKQVDVFVSKDKKFIMFGNAYSGQTGERFASKKTPIKRDTSELKGLSEYVIGNGKNDYYLFSYPDCGHCIKLEESISKRGVRNDVTLHFLPYPLSHPGKILYFMEMSDEDKKKVMVKGMHSVVVPKDFRPKRETTQRLAKIREQGQKVGLTGTPYLINSDGIKTNAYAILKKGG